MVADHHPARLGSRRACLSRRQRARPASPSRPSAAAPPRLLRLRGLPQHIVSAVLRHAREVRGRQPLTVSTAASIWRRGSTRRSVTYRASEGSWCAARRSTPSPLRSTNDAVAVLADVTVIRGRPSAIRDVGRTVMYTYRPYMHPCVLPMHWQGQTSRECIVHSVSYAIRTMFSPLCLSKQCSAADVALAL